MPYCFSLSVSVSLSEDFGGDWKGHVRFRALHVLGDVDERHDMDRKLTEHGADNVRVEDVMLRSLSG